MTFRTAVTGTPLRVIQVGAGAMGQIWARTIAASDDVELVGLVDLDLAAARRTAAAHGYADVPVAVSLPELIGPTGAEAVINVTVPPAHHPVNVQALTAGLPVLCEKPIAPTVAEALATVAVAEQCGELLMINQSRRYFNTFQAFRQVVGELGAVGTVACEFFKELHPGGFREQMAHPLLVDMAIHPFDAVRALLGEDPVAVYAESYNPAWSWYAGDAAASAIFEFPSGARFAYNGSWCGPGRETSWNGQWRVSGERGMALWDGDTAPVVDVPGGQVAVVVGDDPEESAGSLAEFVHCLRTGETPATAARSNVQSLAMVEAAVRSGTERRRVELAEVLAEAHRAGIEPAARSQFSPAD